MNRDEFMTFRKFLIEKIREEPYFSKLNDTELGVALCYTLFYIFKKNKTNREGTDDLIYTFFNKRMNDLDRDFKTYYPKVQTTNMTWRFLNLNMIGATNRKLYYFFADSQCMPSTSSCIKLIPIGKYSDIRLSENTTDSHIREMLGLDPEDIYLFIDTFKLKEEFDFDIDGFGSTFFVECKAEEFKLLCDKDILCKGSEKPESELFTSTSFPWPDDTVETRLLEHPVSKKGNITILGELIEKKNEISDYLKRKFNFDVEYFLGN